MVPKPLVACLAATALVSAAALMPVRASAASRGGPQPGTWNWPPYTEGATSGAACGYVVVKPMVTGKGSGFTGATSSLGAIRVGDRAGIVVDRLKMPPAAVRLNERTLLSAIPDRLAQAQICSPACICHNCQHAMQYWARHGHVC